jgi:hypothetical protein
LFIRRDPWTAWIAELAGPITRSAKGISQCAIWIDDVRTFGKFIYCNCTVGGRGCNPGKAPYRFNAHLSRIELDSAYQDRHLLVWHGYLGNLVSMLQDDGDPAAASHLHS